MKIDTTKSSIIVYIRFCYWLGAVLDLISAMLYLFPSILLKQLGIDNTLITFPTRYVLGNASALMFGWTALLIWAVQKPIQRKAVLLLTVFPVVSGLFLSALYLASIDNIDKIKVTPLIVLPLSIGFLYILAYYLAISLQKRK